MMMPFARFTAFCTAGCSRRPARRVISVVIWGSEVTNSSLAGAGVIVCHMALALPTERCFYTVHHDLSQGVAHALGGVQRPELHAYPNGANPRPHAPTKRCPVIPVARLGALREGGKALRF